MDGVMRFAGSRVWRVFGAWALTVLAVFVALAAEASAQEPDGPTADRMEQPTEQGIRFTPGMARAMADLYVQQVFQPRYELDEAEVGEANERVARRLMQLAHHLDEQGHEAGIEKMVEQMMKSQAEGGQGGRAGMPPEVARAMGETLGPMMPSVRQMMRGVAQDLRPMLSPRQQLKFAAEMMAAETAMDAFEKTMDRWASGDVDTFGDPFTDPGEARSRALERARQRAQGEIDRSSFEQWKRYVEEAKGFYEFDDAQAAAADSLLREAIDRATQIVEDPAYRDRIHANRLLFHLLGMMDIHRTHPLHYDLEQAYERHVDPIQRIEEELRRKVDGVATRNQRQAAMARITEHLAEAGYTEEPLEPQPAGQEPDARGGSPASAAKETNEDNP